MPNSNRNNGMNDQNRNRQRMTYILIAAIMVGLFFMSGSLMDILLGVREEEVPYTVFLEAVNDRQIEEIELGVERII